ncbi:MAG: adhesin transport system membrane fusion protein [Sphingobacteriales bacterium]|jgi:adhesin transport system membrane fusion protein
MNMKNKKTEADDDDPFKNYHTITLLKGFKARKILTRILVGIFVFILIVMFLPWTQNVKSSGNVTAINPSHRPQKIQSVIGGRIEKWYVNEGDLVKKGDTILFLSELKSEYMDPEIVPRAGKQIKAKEQSVSSYMEKVKALDAQIYALLKTQKLKIEQTENYIKQGQLKIESDSINLKATETEYSIAQVQYKRMEQLHKDGLKSLTDLEQRKQKLQDALAKIVNVENKLSISRNDYLNAIIERTSIQNQYSEKLAKTESEKYAALSDMYHTEGEVAKMQTQMMNYFLRTEMYHITAPQDGYITKAIKTGIGETVKEGEDLLTFMPSDYELAVELYVEPLHLPLLEKGQHIRIIFDGWPNIVFSGWPNSSYGTYGGEVVAIDNFVSGNGKYRILITKDENDYPWPKELRPSAGAFGMALLKDVPIWYELWRNISGFPPDYYKSSEQIKAIGDTK